MKITQITGVKTKRFLIFAILAILFLFPCIALGNDLYAFGGAVLMLLFAYISWKNARLSKVAGFVLTLLLFALTAVLFAWLSQYVLQLDLFVLGKRKAALAMVIVFAVAVLFWIITNHSVRSAQLTAIAITVLSISNYYVYTFRGSEMAPNDFMSVNTALTVAYDYEYELTTEIVYAAGILLVFLAFTTALPVFKFKKKRWGRVMQLPILAAAVIFNAVESRGLSAEYFEQEGSQFNGYLVNFMLQVQGIFIEPPRHYSRRLIRDIADELYTEPETLDTSEYPDVIVIMDESFADIDYIGDGLETNRKVIPYIKSLSENTTKGYALSSVYGGGTPNSEYEVLTGIP